MARAVQRGGVYVMASTAGSSITSVPPRDVNAWFVDRPPTGVPPIPSATFSGLGGFSLAPLRDGSVVLAGAAWTSGAGGSTGLYRIRPDGSSAPFASPPGGETIRAADVVPFDDGVIVTWLTPVGEPLESRNLMHIALLDETGAVVSPVYTQELQGFGFQVAVAESDRTIHVVWEHEPSSPSDAPRNVYHQRLLCDR
jgi:hypothetical protein